MAGESKDQAEEPSHHLPIDEDDRSRDGLTSYAGRWIATIDGKVIAQGGTPSQVLQAARAMRYKEIPQINYVPTQKPFILTSQLENILPYLPGDIPIYLVGGAVRDTLLSHMPNELDFVLDGDAIKVGRKVANRLGAAFYPLDEIRNTSRVISVQPDGKRLILDFSIFRGPDLESDLRARDFTINAMALDVRQMDRLLDPMGGAADIRAKRLRACSQTTFHDDPLRVLRGVRFAAELGYRISPDTLQLMREAVVELHRISPERVRNEIVRIMAGTKVSAAIKALDMLGVLNFAFPELQALKSVDQSSPHLYDVWEHTLYTLNKLEQILSMLEPDSDLERSSSLMTGLVSIKLGRYREQIKTHLGSCITPDRSSRGLLFMAALYHDVGKPQTSQPDDKGRIHFFDHEKVGAEIVSKRATYLRFSNQEVSRLKRIVRHHLRPLLLAQTGKPPSKRAIYRYFRDTEEAGVDICLLSLADVWATYGFNMTQEIWIRQLDVVRSMFEAWWELSAERVTPPVLLNGNDLIEELHLTPGPEIGELLERVREAQVVGEIGTREQALIFARSLMTRGDY